MAPVVVRIELIAGRYHAHPWGEAQHAMAGPEWPPSPWRLLRALASAWFEARPAPCSAEERDKLFEALGRAAPPTICLPPASFEEVPYYQPVTKDGKVNTRVLHFDHFAVPGGTNGRETASVFYFCFDANLDERQRSLLRNLVSRVRYVGRAESRAALSIEDEMVAPPPGLELVHLAETSFVESANESPVRRRVLVTTNDFQAGDLWQVRDGDASTAPVHLVESLIKRGRALPDGTEWRDYAVPQRLLLPSLPIAKKSRRPRAERYVEIRFRLFRRIPLPLAEAVRIARAFRGRAVRLHENANNHPSMRLTGREAGGSVAKGHRHAFFLPIPDQRTGNLQQLTVRLLACGESFDPDEIDALLSVTRVFRRDRYPVLVVAERLTSTCATQDGSRLWRSVTPFLAPLRHPAARDRTEVEEQLATCMTELCGVRPVVRRCAGPAGLGKITPVYSHFYGARGSGPRLIRRAAGWFELEFHEPVVLPRPVGTDAHFGLGQFRPQP